MNSQGLIISILILISLMLICHISNYLYNKNLKEKNNFSNLTLSIPTTTKPIDYNKIYYEPKGITSNLSCSQAQQQANIPCDIVSSSSVLNSSPLGKYTPNLRLSLGLNLTVCTILPPSILIKGDIKGVGISVIAALNNILLECGLLE